jgi:uncharacterized heparinase superfamily protein
MIDQIRRNRRARKTQTVAWRTRRGKAAKAFISQPMVRGIGSAQKGLQLAAGNFLIEGRLIKDMNAPIWDVEKENFKFQEKAQSFFWLDHLTANGSPTCISKAKDWFSEWLVQYGDGDNFAWTPSLAGARVIRMINHAIIFMVNTTEKNQKNYFSAISHHARFLKKRRQFAPEGLPRFQALVGYVYCTLALEEFSRDLKPALRALTRECENYIASDGGIPTRNPEELLDIFTLLVWVDQGMTLASFKPDRALLNAIERIAPAIRTMRMGSGALAEFHGGRASNSARIDQILQDSGARATTTSDIVMGYSRVEAGGAVLIMDTGPAEGKSGSTNGFECALAFEFSSGEHSVFNSVGSGRDLSQGPRRASRTVLGYNVASIKPFFSGQAGLRRKLPTALASDMDVTVQRTRRMADATVVLSATHTGYRRAFGLTYNRTLELPRNGRIISGTDRFYCDRKRDHGAYDTAVKRQVAQSIPFIVKFNIFPDVDAELDLGGTAVSLQLPNNQVWIFKASGGELVLEDSSYSSSEHLKPRATKQIVVTSDVVNYEGAVSWMLTRL